MDKCSECGFLCVRNTRSFSLDEASGDFREKGQVAQVTDEKGANSHYLNEIMPLCFARCAYLNKVLKDIKQKSNPFQEIVNIIHVDISCEGFTKWQQGFTPKEHRELLDRKWMLDFQVKREDGDRQWRDAQRRDDLSWRADQERKVSSRHRWDLIITGFVATLLICGATIAAAFISKGH